MLKRASVGSVAEAYLELLAARGVEYFFANAGTDFAPIVEAYARRAAQGQALPRPITVPHETTAVALAHGYAMVTGRPQAVMVHVTVGTANALGRIMNAARAHVPLLVTARRAAARGAGRGAGHAGLRPVAHLRELPARPPAACGLRSRAVPRRRGPCRRPRVRRALVPGPRGASAGGDGRPNRPRPALLPLPDPRLRGGRGAPGAAAPHALGARGRGAGGGRRAVRGGPPPALGGRAPAAARGVGGPRPCGPAGAADRHGVALTLYRRPRGRADARDQRIRPRSDADLSAGARQLLRLVAGVGARLGPRGRGRRQARRAREDRHLLRRRRGVLLRGAGVDPLGRPRPGPAGPVRGLQQRGLERGEAVGPAPRAGWLGRPDRGDAAHRARARARLRADLPCGRRLRRARRGSRGASRGPRAGPPGGAGGEAPGARERDLPEALSRGSVSLALVDQGEQRPARAQAAQVLGEDGDRALGAARGAARRVGRHDHARVGREPVTGRERFGVGDVEAGRPGGPLGEGREEVGAVDDLAARHVDQDGARPHLPEEVARE